jgi:putative oxidoreductase
MKNIFKVNGSSNSTALALLVARAGIAFLMLMHGLPKLSMLFSGAPVQFPPVMGLSAELSLALVVLAEVGCSLLLLAGFATRLATIPLIVTMLVAVLLIHGADPISIKEPALLYLLVYTVLLFGGSGKYSVDYLLQNRKVPFSKAAKKIEDPTLAIYQ